jgi:phosphoribosylanthranilate isomerase
MRMNRRFCRLTRVLGIVVVANALRCYDHCELDRLKKLKHERFALGRCTINNRGMTWIKICGITTHSAASLVVASRPSAIGLNFYPPSPRFVSQAVARSIRVSIPDQIEVVGVFVNESPAVIAATVHEVGLTGVQLHGDESPEELLTIRKCLPETRLCKAFRISEEGMHPVHNFLARCESLSAVPDRILVDARVAGLYGGSGKRVDWILVDKSKRLPDCPPMILAGGLGPENVANAIAITEPWGVDVASGVENDAGQKDAGLANEFVRIVRSTSTNCENP